jgi:hypothetical protein
MSHSRFATFASVAGVTLAIFGLGGCHRSDATPDGAARHGRYAGVGIYAPSQAWTKLDVLAPSDFAAAKLSDDQAIIVVVDSETGEVRACGDLSGYCVGLDPWRAGLAKSQLAPVKLTSHVATSTDAANTADNSAAATATEGR